MGPIKLPYKHLKTPVVSAILALTSCSAWALSTHEVGHVFRHGHIPPVSQRLHRAFFDSPRERLVPGKSVARSISGSEKHSFEIRLSRNEYMRLVLDKGDLDLGVTVVSPEAAKVVENAPLPRAVETFSIVAGQSGIYALTIRSLETEGYSGRYELRSDKPRMARPRDILSLTAQRSLQLADRLCPTWKAESLREAVTKYIEARDYSRRAGDFVGEGVAILGAADVFFHLSENRRSLVTYRAALWLGESNRDIGLQIKALNSISGVLIDLGRLEASLRYSTRARQLCEQTGDKLGLAASLNNIGLQYYSTGNLLKAIPVLVEALSAFQATSDRRGQAETLTNLGYTRQDLGDPTAALESFERSLNLATGINDQRLQALNLTAIGLVNSVLGEKQKALEFHSRALMIFRGMGNRYGEAVVNNGIANVYSDIGENDNAIRSYSRALRLFIEIGDRDFEGLTMGSIGNVYLSMGDPKQALIWCKRRLALSRLVKSRWVAAHTLNDIGRVYDSMGDSRKAVGYFNHALAEEQAMGDRRGQAYSLNSIGLANERLGHAAIALTNYKEALALFREVAHGDGQIQTLHNIARTEGDIGEMKQAHEAVRSLIALVETQRVKVAGEEFRTSYFASVHKHYELYIDVLMRMHLQTPWAGYGAAALESAEKARARGLLDMLREARTDIREGASPELLERERTLQSTLNAKAASLTRFLNRMPGQEEVADLKKELTRLTSEYELVEAQIRADSPRYAALTQPQTMGVQEIQKRILDPDTLLLEYSLGKERSYVWSVTPTSLNAYVLPARAEIEDAVKRLYASVALPPHERSAGRPDPFRPANPNDRYRRAAAELSKMLLGPMASELGRKRLAIVAEGALQYVPFSTLIDPVDLASDGNNAQPLVANHEIVELPSASVLAELRRDIGSRTPPSKGVVVFANPVFDKYDSRIAPSGEGQKPPEGNRGHRKNRSGFTLGRTGIDDGPTHFQRLSFSQSEAEEICSLIPKDECRMFLDFDANRLAATSPEIGDYRIVHFGTHALLDNTHPNLSMIVLSLVDRRGQPQNGFLRLNEIYNLRLRANLVVLSACETALGKQVQGEGLLGLTRGFMYAGAPRVVASLWEVDDQATAQLMIYFYRGMLTDHLTAGQALRAAQMAMRNERRWDSPYYWGGFVLQGEWK